MARRPLAESKYYEFCIILLTLFAGIPLSIITDKYLVGDSNILDEQGVLLAYTLVFAIFLLLLLVSFKKAFTTLHDTITKNQENLESAIHDITSKNGSEIAELANHSRIEVSEIAKLSQGQVESCTEHHRSQIQTLVQENVQVINKLIDAKVELLVGDTAYETMAKEVNLAEVSIDLLSRIRYDGQSATNNEGGHVSTARQSYYDALLNAAEKDIIFNRVIMVDNDCLNRWHSIIADFKPIAEEIVKLFLKQGSKGIGPKTAISIAGASLEMNMLVIDDCKLFFNVFTEKPNKTYETELMFYVESDKRGLYELMCKYGQISRDAKTITLEDAQMLAYCLAPKDAAIRAGM
ncbi:hypothetical protein [Vibrio owensii]|uniref:hypothetical protein n=1 Tax=Vibrio owensii TaxID=696485 RepID=UPI00215B7D37|nr:hypothetical protein [Vibrio owensii]MCR9944690.1 hypothetical protein [Vibrio owensii]